MIAIATEIFPPFSMKVSSADRQSNSII